jgi:hypothetical protein
MARLDKVLAGTQITDEYTYRAASTALGLLHDAFLASTVVVRTAAGGGGTLLTLTTDYTLSAEDTALTTEAGATVYTKLAVVNGTYQNTALYVSYKCVTDYNRASDINNRGRKIDLEVSYVSSDLISISPGSVEVNDVMVTKTAATTFTTGATNFPGANAWVFGCMDIAGNMSLEAATGTGSVRPSDACFQMSGSSVGYLDIGKHAYYFNAGKRIIFAAHRVSATNWYFINMGDGCSETGQNSLGYWERNCIGRTMRQYGTGSQTTDTAAGAYYSNAAAKLFPMTFSVIRNCISQTNFGGVIRWASAYTYNTTQFTGLVWGNTNSETIPYSWNAEGTF